MIDRTTENHVMSLLTDLLKFFRCLALTMNHADRVWSINYTTTLTARNQIEVMTATE